MGMNRPITLTVTHLRYLKEAAYLPESLARIVREASQTGDQALLIMPGETAEEFRSAFTERLAEVGFDAGYGLTDEGRLLEDLIDRFDPD